MKGSQKLNGLIKIIYVVFLMQYLRNFWHFILVFIYLNQD